MCWWAPSCKGRDSWGCGWGSGVPRGVTNWTEGTMLSGQSGVMKSRRGCGEDKAVVQLRFGDNSPYLWVAPSLMGETARGQRWGKPLLCHTARHRVAGGGLTLEWNTQAGGWGPMAGFSDGQTQMWRASGRRPARPEQAALSPHPSTALPQVQRHLRGENPEGAEGAPTPPGHQQSQRAEGERAWAGPREQEGGAARARL